MNVRHIAGHTLVDDLNGSKCVCGMTWAALLNHREYWQAGVTGIAHQGALRQSECDGLNAEVERIWRAMAEQ